MRRTTLLIIAFAGAACADEDRTNSDADSTSGSSAASMSAGGGGAASSSTASAGVNGSTVGVGAGGASTGAGGQTVATLLAPEWYALVESACILQPGRVAVAPDGTVGVFAQSGGYSQHPLVFGSGASNELAISDLFHFGVAWYDGADGHMVRASQITGFAPPAGGARSGDIAFRGDGSTVVTGSFANHVSFHPGTSGQMEQVTLQATNGSNLDIAYDPFLLRYAPDGAPSWFTRGRTPAPLLTTWFNFSEQVVANADGSVIVTGDVEQSGLVLGDGKPGATTMNSGYGGYVARYEADGHLGWVLEVSGNWGTTGLTVASDGSIYVLSHAMGTTLAAGTAQAVTLPASAKSFVAKLSAAGTLLWVRTIGWTALGLMDSDLAVDPSGGVILGGTWVESGDVTIGDGAGAPLATVTLSDPQAFVARIAPDGSIGYARGLGADLGYYSAVAVDTSGDTWLGAYTSSTATKIELDGAPPLALPPLPNGGAVLLRVDAAGNRKEAVLATRSFPLEELAPTPDGGLASVSQVWSTSAPPAIGAPGGGSTALPLATQEEGSIVVVMKLSP